MAVTAVIPLKSLAEAKGRLATTLTPARRRALVAGMFRHVAATCLAAPSVEAVLVVAGDAEGARLAEEVGTVALVPHRPGLHTALELADAHLDGAPATLVVAADLPLLAVDDIEALCEAGDVRGARTRAAVVVAPTQDGGTGGLLRRPGDITGTAFGPGSAAAHRRMAAEAGVIATVVEREGFALDVDTARQLRELASVAPGLLPFA